MSDSKYTREQMMEKIQKLLALSEDTTNEHQAAAAGAKVQELLQQWSISEEELRGATTDKPVSYKIVTSTPLRRTLERWEDYLAVAVSKAFFCHAVHSKAGKQMYFAGRDVDAEVAAYTYDMLRHTLDEMAKQAFAAHASQIKQEHRISVYNVAQCREWSNCHPTVYRSRWIGSWLLGAELTVASKLKEQTATFQASSSTALMVVETRGEEAKRFAQSHFNGLTQKASKSVLIFHSAHEQGREEGKQVEIRKGLQDKDTSKLLN